MENYQNKIKTERLLHKEFPERKLWKAVLNQLLHDAFEPTYITRHKEEKKHAIDYMKTMHEDFFTVCENAGFDPNYVYRKVKKHLFYKLVKEMK